MVNRYSATVLGNLCSDTRESVSEVDLATDAKMVAALSEATGIVRAHLKKGDRYTDDDLSGLTGESLEFLKGMTCTLAFWFLWRRKPYLSDKDPQKETVRREAEEVLKMLRDGTIVLDVAANIDAGKPQADTIPRATIINYWELRRDKDQGRFFPARRSYRNT
jgi:hypothetical protein